MTRADHAARAASLAAAGTAFVWATVVRAERPTSAKAGDSALVLADGEIDGFVGGECAESTVRAHALELLTTGDTRLLRITPEPADDVDGVITVHNPCLSGGTLDVFLEPSEPQAVVLVHGTAPIATALLRADRVFGAQVRAISPGEQVPVGAAAVVVASHGNDEVAVLSQAVRAAVPYIGLVASRTRGPAVLDALDVDEAERERIHTPAGLDIGARTAPEVALSILAEIVADRRAGQNRGLSASLLRAAAEMATDPVCGMAVAALDASPHVDGPTGRVYFCGSGCRTAYIDHPAAYG